MKYLFIGLGSIGIRHLVNLRSITRDEIIAYRTQKSNNEELERKYKIKSYFDIEEVLDKKPDVAFITNPTSLHVPTAINAAEAGCHLFIEKPLSHNMNGVDKLIKISEKNDLITFVGFNMRFHPDLIMIKKLLHDNAIGRPFFAKLEVGEYLSDWHPYEDYRKGYAAKNDMGGGVVLSLIHELDYANWLFGDIRVVSAFTGKLSNLEIDVEDTSSIIMKTDNNIFIEVHMDYIQRPPSRSCKIVGENGTIFWDYYKNTINVFESKTKKCRSFKNKDFKRNLMYLEELKHFLSCIKNKHRTMVDLCEAKKSLRLALAVKESSDKGHVIKIK